MAETRCANPEYQLEVDELMLDYLLYQCIKAHIDEFRARPIEHHAEAEELGQSRDASTRLLQIFDSMFLRPWS